ncbi:MAG TPA: cation diffusion facilitator family transporter [Xanthobacteraceae bacterium]|nr:cation diffusion facilitator family transporter [Xanthobacteraceae bacterium]
MAARSSSRKVVYAALVGNLLVAITKFGAAAWTGSSAMLSEGIHSVVDTSNEVLLLYGFHRASRPPDRGHPLGYGRELYFWSFIVAVLIFTLGAGFSMYEGILHVLHASPIQDPWVSYLVLGLSFAFEFGSWWVAATEFRARKGPLGYFEAIRRSKDPPGFLVLAEDTAALIGLLIALAGTAASQWFELPFLDGVASIGIGVLLAATAVVLAREIKDLLIGEPAHSRITESILALARSEPGVERASGLVTVHLAPHQVVAALDVEFDDRLTAPEIESVVLRLEQHIKDVHPEVIALFIKPKTVSRPGEDRS